jgi:transcriptional regulator with XRE-family HTH domain
MVGNSLPACQETVYPWPVGPWGMVEKRPEPRQTLARSLRFLMTKTGMSEADVSKASGVSKKSINNMLNARHAPNLDHVDEVARVFGLNLWHMIMNGLPDELVASRKLDELISHYGQADEHGRESIDRVAEIASEYRSKKQ